MGWEGIRQIGAVFHPSERAFNVCQALKKVVTAHDHGSSLRFMAVMDPSKGRVLMVAPGTLAPEQNYKRHSKPLLKWIL